MRLSWSSAATLRSTNSPNLGVDLAHVLGDLAAQILIDLDDLQLGLGDLALGLGDGGDQLRRVRPRAARASRSSAVSRVICTRLFFQSSRTPSSSLPIRAISRALASCWAVRPLISSCSCVIRCFSCAFWPRRAERRSSNSLRSLATATATVGSLGASKQLRRER